MAEVHRVKEVGCSCRDKYLLGTYASALCLFK